MRQQLMAGDERIGETAAHPEALGFFTVAEIERGAPFGRLSQTDAHF